MKLRINIGPITLVFGWRDVDMGQRMLGLTFYEKDSAVFVHGRCLLGTQEADDVVHALRAVADEIETWSEEMREARKLFEVQ